MKELGRYHREQLAQGIEPYTFGFLGKVMVINDVRDKSLHLYVRYYFVYGRKAESAVH
jgi:hypothetical protein